jgi:hypothetical protein
MLTNGGQNGNTVGPALIGTGRAPGGTGFK